ncbi:MAG TPA: hypothetical protein VF618_02380 [Thermoanaerobaculia bacterium]
MGKLTVHFHGICTHFIGIVPGIPHRVVLPDATALQLGIVNVADSGGTYFLMPHFSILRMTNTVIQQTIGIPGAIDGGNIIDGVRLQVANPSRVGNHYDDSFIAGVPRLKDFVDQYAYSEEVVIGGRAAVYFDLFSAVFVVPFPEPQTQATDVIATIDTIGAPELLVTTFRGGPAARFNLAAHPEDDDAEVELLVANQGMDCFAPTNQLDFLLHYLTARTGIPRQLRSPTPGLVPPLEPVSRAAFDAGADALKTLDYPRRFDAPCFRLEKILDPSYITSPACSNSQFP